MRKLILLLFCVFLLACAHNKPAYKTAKGKKKLRYYNNLQYGGKKNVPYPN